MQQSARQGHKLQPHHTNVLFKIHNLFYHSPVNVALRLIWTYFHLYSPSFGQLESAMKQLRRQKALSYRSQDACSTTSHTEAIDDRIRTQHVLLAQSVIWIVAVGVVMWTGVLRQWDDTAYVLFSVSVASPALIIPSLVDARSGVEDPWCDRYWFKLNVWVGIVVAFGTYLGTHYFFDLMGMQYSFGGNWTFDSDVVGHSGQEVPIFMYPLTHAYFMTYFAALMVAEREIVRRIQPGLLGRFAIVIGLSYAVAFLETFFMASDLLQDLFAYQDRHRMLRLGSFGYSSYFIIGLPMIQRIDGNGERWTLDRLIIEALATCMGILLFLDFLSKLVGPL